MIHHSRFPQVLTLLFVMHFNWAILDEFLCLWRGCADRKLGKGKIDDEDVTFQRMVAKVNRIVLLLLLHFDVYLYTF
jgi:hypothetical protein